MINLASGSARFGPDEKRRSDEGNGKRETGKEKPMSAMVFEEGSVISFTPEGFEVVVLRLTGELAGLKPVTEEWPHQAVGWAVVVTHRDTWVVETRVEPMVTCCDDVVPAVSHYQMAHWAAGEVPWGFKLTSETVRRS